MKVLGKYIALNWAFERIVKQVPHAFALLARTLRPRTLRFCLTLILSLFAANMVFATASYAETRSLKLYYLHTGEKATITFKKNGRYIKSGLRKLNRFLRDWRRNEPTKMDPRLFDLIWEVYKETGSRKYIHVISGFRSLKTNNILRKRGRGVAKRSQHTQGKALDYFIPGVSLAKLRAIGLRKGIGGVGYYPRSGSPFVHMDTGRIRHWPRMTRRQLKKVFPRGRTLHVPTDGKPLPGYKQALADAKRRKSGKAVYTAKNSSNKSGGFLAKLFNPGGGDDEAEDNASKATTPRKVKSIPVAKPKPRENAPRDNTIDNVIQADKNNPTLPNINSVPLPKLAPRKEETPIAPTPDGNSPIGALIAAIPTPRPDNLIDQSIADDAINPVEETQVATVEQEEEASQSSTLTALVDPKEKSTNSIASRIESALLASNEVDENVDIASLAEEATRENENKSEALPFQQKNINVEAEKAIMANLEPEATGEQQSAEKTDKIAKIVNDTNADDDTTTSQTDVALLDQENPLLKDRQELINDKTELAQDSIPLPKARPSEDEIIYQKLVSKVEQNKATALDVALSEEKASIPDLKIGDLADKSTTLLGFQKNSIAEIALMRAPAYGQNMIKLAPSRIIKGGFHNDFDITPTNQFANSDSATDLATLDE